MDLGFVLEELGRRGIKGVLVEGGGETATRFVEEGLADKMTLFYAPKLLGAEGVPMIGALRATKMAESLRFTVSGVERVGEDVAVTLYPGSPERRNVFTGLVEEVGASSSLEEGEMLRLRISADRVTEDTRAGDSVSVNGACLTVGEVEGRTLDVLRDARDAAADGARHTQEGSAVNLERAMASGDRFGGHIVQGHVDGVGEVLGVRPEGEAEIWEFAAPEAVLRYCVEKGSICVDGISLTVVSVGRRVVHRLDPAPDPRQHEPRGAARGRPGKPGGRCYRQVRRAAIGAAHV